MAYVHGATVSPIQRAVLRADEAERRAAEWEVTARKQQIYIRELEVRLEQYRTIADATAAEIVRGEPVCGTYSGWAKHKRDNTVVCDPCRLAHNTYRRELRNRNDKERRDKTTNRRNK